MRGNGCRKTRIEFFDRGKGMDQCGLIAGAIAGVQIIIAPEGRSSRSVRQFLFGQVSTARGGLETDRRAAMFASDSSTRGAADSCEFDCPPRSGIDNDSSEPLP